MGRRAQACLEAVRALHYATDRQVLAHLELPDMNCVRPRLTELVQGGWLVEAGTAECPVTRKQVRVLRLATGAERAERAAARLTSAGEQMAMEWRAQG